MPAYVIANVEVTDPVGYEEYKQLAALTVAQYDGRYVVRGGASELVEGTTTPKRVVVLEFPSMARAREWFDSPEYAPARRIRHETAKAEIILADGI